MKHYEVRSFSVNDDNNDNQKDQTFVSFSADDPRVLNLLLVRM